MIIDDCISFKLEIGPMRRSALGLVVIGLASAAIWAAPWAKQTDTVSTRELVDINWMEFKEAVPSKIDTVLLPTGTIEPHGVINNGADVTAPVAITRTIARATNAMVAPVIPYGITGRMDAYPGSFSISEPTYRTYVREVLSGLAKVGFKNLVIVNGHGGPQSAVLEQVAMEVGQEKKVRTLVVHWWGYASDVTLAVFGEDGGHAGWNETAFIQAIDKNLVHPERYRDDLATVNPGPGTYAAYPSPSSIGLYKRGQGYVKFDQKKADEYYAKVTDKVAKLIVDTRRKWDEIQK
jgi:creatinine amidohydrolase